MSDLTTQLREIVLIDEVGSGNRLGKDAADEIERQQAEIDRLREALERIHQWTEAYPKTVFSIPDLEAMREILTIAGMPTALDAAHGTWGRRLLKDIGGIARAAIEDR